MKYETSGKFGLHSAKAARQLLSSQSMKAIYVVAAPKCYSVFHKVAINLVFKHCKKKLIFVPTLNIISATDQKRLLGLNLLNDNCISKEKEKTGTSLFAASND